MNDRNNKTAKGLAREHIKKVISDLAELGMALNVATMMSKAELDSEGCIIAKDACRMVSADIKDIINYFKHKYDIE